MNLVLENHRIIAEEIRAITGVTTADDFLTVASFVGVTGSLHRSRLKNILRRCSNLADFEAAWKKAFEEDERRRAQSERDRGEWKRQEVERQLLKRKRRSELSSRPRKPCPKCGRMTPLELCRKCGTACVSCGNSTTALHEILDVLVCPKCRSKDDYRLITQSTALKDFQLRKSELEILAVIETKNPHYRSASPMKLYLLSQVQELRNKLAEQDPNRFFLRMLKQATAGLSY